MPIIEIDDLAIDINNRRVARAGQEIHLRPKEYALLAELAGARGRVVSHRQLLEAIWGFGHEQDLDYLRVAARGLRLKLERNPAQPKIIRNEPAVGYRLVTDGYP